MFGHRKAIGIAAVCAAAVLGAAAVAARAQQLVPAKLNTDFLSTGGAAAPLLLAEKKGYFKEGGVLIDIVRGFGSADVVTKVAAGTYEAGTGYLPELVRAKAEDPNLDAIAVAIAYDTDPNGLVGPKTNSVTGPKDIAGKRISAQPGNSSRQIFPAFATTLGIDQASIKWVSVGSPLLAITVQQGNADLAAGFVSTAVANFEKIGYTADQLMQITYSDFVPNLYGNALILRKSWAQKNPDAAKGLVRAYVRGLIDSRKEQDAAMNILMEREPLLNRAVEVKDLSYGLEKYYFTDRVLQKGFGYHTKADVDAFIKLIAEPFGLKRVPTADEIYTDAYLPPVADRAVPK
jgi:NitT/TauT family transport system substrate-binding protein